MTQKAELTILSMHKGPVGCQLLVQSGTLLVLGLCALLGTHSLMW